jgi:hypothetical protein
MRSPTSNFRSGGFLIGQRLLQAAILDFADPRVYRTCPVSTTCQELAQILPLVRSEHPLAASKLQVDAKRRLAYVLRGGKPRS